MLQRVMLRFYVENFLSHNAETFHRGTLLCYFRNFLVAKKFMDKREGGVSRFSVEVFLSHNAETYRRGTFCAVFQKISVSENVYG